MRVKVLFFGQLKDIVGRAEDSLELPDSASAERVFAHYASQYPRLELLRPSIVFARNHQFCPPGTPVAAGDEIAFLPPVSGGSGSPALHSVYTQQIADAAGNFFALTRDPIEVDDLKRRVVCGSDGAVIDFEGVVRNNTKGRPTRYLEYECYEPMAIRVMAELGAALRREHAIGRLAIVHRLGSLEIGEASVVIVVAAPHRRAAFAAALDAIDRLKKRVPIWKKEHFADGDVWVEGEWDDSVLRP